jgi:hypothetical protein
MTNSSYKIKANNYNWIFIIKNFNNKNFDQILKILLEDITLVYLEINNVVYRHNLYKDKYLDHVLSLHPLSFIQPDNTIQSKLNYILLQLFESVQINHLYLLGGQIVLFSKLLNYNTLFAYTDTESIYVDAKSYDIPIKLISYKSYQFDKFIDKSYLIINNGKNGLGPNICDQLIKTTFKLIIIISCNSKSFLRDYNFIKQSYKIIKQYQIKTSYDVNIYLLEHNLMSRAK